MPKAPSSAQRAWMTSISRYLQIGDKYLSLLVLGTQVECSRRSLAPKRPCRGQEPELDRSGNTSKAIAFTIAELTIGGIAGSHTKGCRATFERKAVGYRVLTDDTSQAIDTGEKPMHTLWLRHRYGVVPGEGLGVCGQACAVPAVVAGELALQV